MTAGRWELSFNVPFIEWDGDRLLRLEESRIRESLARFRDLGLHWAFVAGVQLFEEAAFDMKDGLHMLRGLLDEYGFRLTSNHCVQPSLARIGQDQAPVREMMRQVVEHCAIINPNALVIHSGQVNDREYWGSTFGAFNEEVARHGLDAFLELAAENLKFMARLAVPHNMNLALESMGRLGPTGDTETLVRLVDMIDEPNVGYCLDSGHVHIYGESVPDWVRRAGDKLFETHFHDNRMLGPVKYPGLEQVTAVSDVDEHLPVGFGTISWLDVISALDESDFPGPVTFETGGWPHEDPTESLRLAILWWRTCEKIALQPRTNT